MPRKLWPRDIAEIKKLRAGGLFYREIGARFGISPGTASDAVNGRCASGRTVRRFSDAEKAELRAKRRAGMSYYAIAKLFGRAESTVYYALTGRY